MSAQSSWDELEAAQEGLNNALSGSSKNAY